MASVESKQDSPYENKSIGIIRGAFDPVHRGHLETFKQSYKELGLDKLYVVLKFIGEKDISTSIMQRMQMMAMQLQESDVPMQTEILRQHVLGHKYDLKRLREIYNGNVINICGSDKIIRELDVYGEQDDTFCVTRRTGYPITKDMYAAALRKNITLVEVATLSTSSTLVRELISDKQIFQKNIHEGVSAYIQNEGLYHFDDSEDVKSPFLQGWYNFIERLELVFPHFNLHTISEPEFNPIQHKEAWPEKYVRHCIKVLGLKNEELFNFVLEAEKF